MVCRNHRTKPCGMMITYADDVLSGSGPLALSMWAVVFSSCHNTHELEQSPTGGVFDPVGGTPNRNVPKRVRSCQKGLLPKLRDGGVYPRASIPQRGTWSYPTFDHSRSPAIHSRKKKKKLWTVWGSPGSTINAAEFDLESI